MRTEKCGRCPVGSSSNPCSCSRPTLVRQTTGNVANRRASSSSSEMSRTAKTEIPSSGLPSSHRVPGHRPGRHRRQGAFGRHPAAILPVPDRPGRRRLKRRRQPRPPRPRAAPPGTPDHHTAPHLPPLPANPRIITKSPRCPPSGSPTAVWHRHIWPTTPGEDSGAARVIRAQRGADRAGDLPGQMRACWSPPEALAVLMQFRVLSAQPGTALPAPGSERGPRSKTGSE